MGCRGCELQGPTVQGGRLCMEQRTVGQVPALLPHFLFLLRLACPPGVTGVNREQEVKRWAWGRGTANPQTALFLCPVCSDLEPERPS